MSNAADGLSPEDLEAEQALALPEREAISKIGISAGFGIDNFAMPINEATAMNIAANANIAAPIDAAVAANAASVASEATAVADQDSVILQNLEGTATATANQDATIQQ